MPPSALHQIDVVDRNRAAVAEVNHQDGEPDGGFRRRNCQHQQRKYLADNVAQMGRESDKVDVDAEQDELDRHQDNNDVLAIKKDAENAGREQHRTDREVVSEPDRHDSPCPGCTWRTSIAVALVRATCSETFWRFTFTL